MTHRKPLDEIPDLCPKVETDVLKWAALSFESSVWSWSRYHVRRGNGGRTPTEIGRQPLDGDRSTDNKFTDCDTVQSASTTRVRSENLPTLKTKLTSDIVFFLFLYTSRLWTTIREKIHLTPSRESAILEMNSGRQREFKNEI